MTSRFPGESVDRRTDDPGEPPVDPDADVRDDRAPESGLFAARAAGRRDRQWGVLAAISLGGSLGSVARYLVSEAVPVTAGRFPWATFLINVSGCLAIGLLMVLVLDVWPPNRYARPFVGVGILGGYTTFSTFTVETRNLAAHGAWGLAAAYVLGSLVAGLAAVWGGMTLARLFARLPLRGHRGRGRA